jgi:hypothetical protein
MNGQSARRRACILVLMLLARPLGLEAGRIVSGANVTWYSGRYDKVTCESSIVYLPKSGADPVELLMLTRNMLSSLKYTDSSNKTKISKAVFTRAKKKAIQDVDFLIACSPGRRLRSHVCSVGAHVSAAYGCASIAYKAHRLLVAALLLELPLTPAVAKAAGLVIISPVAVACVKNWVAATATCTKPPIRTPQPTKPPSPPPTKPPSPQPTKTQSPQPTKTPSLQPTKLPTPSSKQPTDPSQPQPRLSAEQECVDRGGTITSHCDVCDNACTSHIGCTAFDTIPVGWTQGTETVCSFPGGSWCRIEFCCDYPSWCPWVPH